MKIAQKLLDALLYSHIYLGICAVAISAYTDYFTPFSFSLNYYLFIFLGTILVYNVHRYISLDYNSGALKHERYQKLNTYKNWYLYSSLFSLLGMIFLIFSFSGQLLLSLMIPIIISIFYIFPLFPGNRRLRDYNFVKIVLISTVWTLLTVSIPWLNYSMHQLGELGILSLERFFFIFAIAIPFDFRDMRIDATTRTKTIVSRFGRKSSLRISLLSLTISFVFHSILHFIWLPTGMTEFSIITLSFILIGIILYRGFYIEKEPYHSLVVNGTMIILYLTAFVARDLL